MKAFGKSKLSMVPAEADIVRVELGWRSPSPIEVYWEGDGAGGFKGVYTSNEGDIFFHLLKMVDDYDGYEWFKSYVMPAASIEGGGASASATKTRLDSEPTDKNTTGKPSIKSKSVFDGFLTTPRAPRDASGQEE